MSDIWQWINDAASDLVTLQPQAEGLWANIKAFANSAFTISLAGAFGGAYAAQKIAEKAKVRDEVLKDIRSTNRALILALTITNLALALKNQYIQKLKTSYDADLEKYSTHVSLVRNKIIGVKKPLELSMDFTTLEKMSPPIEALQNIVLEKISTAGRALATVTALADGIANLNATLQRRNDLIASYKAKDLPYGARIEDLYLGLRYGDGNVNNEYGNTLQGAYLYTDDVIFFGMKLCEDLLSHGHRVVTKNKKRLRGASSDLVEADFAAARDLGLIPSDDQYTDWLSGLQEKRKPKSPWWKFRGRNVD